jgi:hypothetical protein
VKAIFGRTLQKILLLVKSRRLMFKGVGCRLPRIIAQITRIVTVKAGKIKAISANVRVEPHYT